MLNMKKLITKLINDFHGCDADRKEVLSGTTVTPTHNGWLVVAATAQSSAGAAPIARIGTAGGTIFGEGMGIVSQGALFIAAAPVKAGETYTITLYRCNLSSVINYY